MKKRFFLSALALCAMIALTGGALVSGRAAASEISDADLPGLVIPIPDAAQSAAPDVTAPVPDAAVGGQVAASEISDDGVLRVYLKSLGDPSSLTLTLDGLYTVEHDAGFRFERGSQIVLANGDGRVYLSVGGLSVDMGTSMTLTRQADGDDAENGLYIAESEKDKLYVGDLTVAAEEGGLSAVLAINIEDYLRGVVAYEMSDSWPLEALKAQAVAARTYAMQRKRSAGERAYDVVDTTADQVFKGYDPQYANVIRAVDETRGIVGTYNGGFATCYYTASNGGQVALPTDVWSGDGDYGYLARTDDPYDLENSYSLVASLEIGMDGSGSEALKQMLLDGLKPQVEAAGYAADGLQIEKITSITPAEPESEGSYMYTKLDFEIEASVETRAYRSAAGDVGAPMPSVDSVPGDLALYGIDYLRRLLEDSPYVLTPVRSALTQRFTVRLDVYAQIKDELGLSLNGGDYELISVRPDLFGYVIEMRRFGHGVGMSQRGAQMMAGRHDMSCFEILKFYYPGMTLEAIDWATPALEPLSALPAGVGVARPDPTPTPTPAPLPALEAGEYYAAVKLGDDSSKLNLRQTPGTQSPVVAQLSNGRRVIVSGEPDGEGWVAVHTAELNGYVKLEYLTAE